MAKSQKKIVNTWDELETIFLIHDVRVVATLHENGGAIVELLEKVEYHEGRQYMTQSDEPPKHTLEYLCRLQVPGSADPLYSESANARIVVSGNHENGKRIEIRGDGWIGYDNEENLEVSFDSPPAMLTERTEMHYPDCESMSEEEFREHMSRDYQMPKHFADALIRVPDPYEEND